MLKFFKRSAARAAPTPVAAPTPAPETPAVEAPAPVTHERRRFQRPLPLPEVVEGNGDSDWAMWEASVSSQKKDQK